MFFSSGENQPCPVSSESNVSESYVSRAKLENRIDYKLVADCVSNKKYYHEV